MKRHNINAETVYFSGAVEIAPKLGRADFICDLVSTGSTLKANGLAPLEHIADISSRLVVNRASMKMKQAQIKSLVAKLGEAVGGNA